MKQIRYFILLFFLFYSCCYSQVKFQNISIEEAQNIIRTDSSEQKILLYFTTSWCSRCKILEKQVFDDKKISESLNEKYVCLKIDGDSQSGKKVLQKFKVIDQYPTTLILDKNMEEVDRTIGYTERDQYVNKLNDAYNDINTLQNLLYMIKQQPDNGHLYFKLAMKYETYRDLKNQLFYMEKAIQFSPYKENHHYWYFVSVLYEKNRNILMAIECLKKAIKLSTKNSQYTSYLNQLKNKI